MEEVVGAPVAMWHALDVEDVVKELGLRKDVCDNGLTTKEFEERLAKYGPNKLSEKDKKSLLRRIWNLVANVLVGILVIVAVVSLIKAIVAKNSEDRLTNLIEVGLIVFVIT